MTSLLYIIGLLFSPTLHYEAINAAECNSNVGNYLIKTSIDLKHQGISSNEHSQHFALQERRKGMRVVISNLIQSRRLRLLETADKNSDISTKILMETEQI